MLRESLDFRKILLAIESSATSTPCPLYVQLKWCRIFAPFREIDFDFSRAETSHAVLCIEIERTVGNFTIFPEQTINVALWSTFRIFSVECMLLYRFFDSVSWNKSRMDERRSDSVPVEYATIKIHERERERERESERERGRERESTVKIDRILILPTCAFYIESLSFKKRPNLTIFHIVDNL